jgi:hypothetical protein
MACCTRRAKLRVSPYSTYISVITETASVTSYSPIEAWTTRNYEVTIEAL